MLLLSLSLSLSVLSACGDDVHLSVCFHIHMKALSGLLVQSLRAPTAVRSVFSQGRFRDSRTQHAVQTVDCKDPAQRRSCPKTIDTLNQECQQSCNYLPSTSGYEFQRPSSAGSVGRDASSSTLVSRFQESWAVPSNVPRQVSWKEASGLTWRRDPTKVSAKAGADMEPPLKLGLPRLGHQDSATGSQSKILCVR